MIGVWLGGSAVVAALLVLFANFIYLDEKLDVQARWHWDIAHGLDGWERAGLHVLCSLAALPVALLWPIAFTVAPVYAVFCGVRALWRELQPERVEVPTARVHRG